MRNLKRTKRRRLQHNADGQVVLSVEPAVDFALQILSNDTPGDIITIWGKNLNLRLTEAQKQHHHYKWLKSFDTVFKNEHDFYKQQRDAIIVEPLRSRLPENFTGGSVKFTMNKDGEIYGKPTPLP